MLAREAITQLTANRFKYQGCQIEHGEVHGGPDTRVDFYKKDKQEVKVSFWLNKDGDELCQVIPQSALGENYFSHNL